MTPRRRLALAVVWTLPSIVFVAIVALVHGGYRIPPPERLDDAARADVIATLRAAVDGTTPRTPTVRAPLAGPIVVTLWSGGRAITRLDATGADVGAATEALAGKLRTALESSPLSAADRTAARLQVDIVTGTGPLGEPTWLFGQLGMPGMAEMLPVNPGVEGVGVTLDGKTTVMLPHELVVAKALVLKKPFEGVQDFVTGIDANKVRTHLTARGGHATGVPVEALFRFRTDTFVEQPAASRDRPPLPLYRGVPPAPALSAQALREAALEGGRFLVAHLAPTPTTPGAPPGRYIYEHDLASGSMTDPKSPSYSMPRHAGTTYFLAELYRITKEPWLREPIERAFQHLVELMSNGKCTRTLPDGTLMDCVMDKTDRIATLGSTALAVVALAEYQRATGDARYLPIATKLAAFLLWMQREDGSFRHRYDPRTQRPDDAAMDLYYSGEAALALARMHVVTQDVKYAAAAERALDWLVGWYDFIVGGFMYGEEHWTCIASEALWPAVQKPAYRDFCHGYGRFLRDQQAPDRGDEADLAGAYTFTPFIMPNNTPAGSRTEAMISAYLLGTYHGTPDLEIRDQIRAALQFTLGQQIRPDNDFAVIGPGRGGVPGSPIDRNVRIDYVQHVCSAMIRASEWIDRP